MTERDSGRESINDDGDDGDDDSDDDSDDDDSDDDDGDDGDDDSDDDDAEFGDKLRFGRQGFFVCCKLQLLEIAERQCSNFEGSVFFLNKK